MTPNLGIRKIANSGASQIRDDRIRQAVERAYTSSDATSLLETAERVFDRLTNAKWPKETLARFASGWRSTHGTALFVSGLIVRLQREANNVDSDARALMFHAASEMGEIIAEDSGVDDAPHAELFARFATQVVGDDDWQLHKFSMPACEKFREHVKWSRLTGEIEIAILSTAASESWNSGEFSYLDPLARRWLGEVLGFDSSTVDHATAYIAHHSGNVELGHFLHALGSWRSYCEAIGREAKPSVVQQTFQNYFHQLLTPFQELDHLLSED